MVRIEDSDEEREREELEKGLSEEELEDIREAEEERKRNKAAEYMNFRRTFDELKRKYGDGTSSESEKLKGQGNHFFSFGLYYQAVSMYSEAIELRPSNAVLWCNRAMAYLKQDMPTEALADAVESLRLDSGESNVKAYWRKAQALLDLGRSLEAEAAADEGIALQKANQHLNVVRRKAREATALERLSSREWFVEIQGGIEKRFKFRRDGTMTMAVCGQELSATFELSVECSPQSMVMKMIPEGPLAGSGPPPPPMPYIYDFREGGEELWLCHPVDGTNLPTSFEGPGFDRMRSSPKVEIEPEVDGEALDTRCTRYIQALNKMLPLIPPQFPAAPSEGEIDEEMVVAEKLSKLKQRWGVEVHRRAVELAKDPSLCGGDEQLAELARGLRQRFVARKIIAAPQEPELNERPPPVKVIAAPQEVHSNTSPPAIVIGRDEEVAAVTPALVETQVAVEPRKPKSAPAGCLAGIARICSRGQ